jgi:hypothetical protein
MMLRAAYRKALESSRHLDEMELHAAGLKNQIFEYLSLFLSALDEKEEQICRRLMRSPYALLPPVDYAGPVADNVVFCKQSERELIAERLRNKDGEAVLVTRLDEI